MNDSIEKNIATEDRRNLKIAKEGPISIADFMHAVCYWDNALCVKSDDEASSQSRR